MNVIQLNDLPDDALVQTLCNGDYEGVDREVFEPMTKKEFVQELLEPWSDEEEDKDEDEIRRIFYEWEVPDGAPTNHLLTIIDGTIVRVCCD